MHTLSDDPAFVRFAKRATAGIEHSGLMVGLLKDEGRGTGQWLAFALQIGVCLLDGKPLLLVAPLGTAIPEKLRAAATVVEYFTPGDATSAALAMKRALQACGLPVQH